MDSDLSQAEQLESARISVLAGSSTLGDSGEPVTEGALPQQAPTQVAPQGDYRIADLFGRCFLGLCLIVHTLYTWLRREKPMMRSAPSLTSESPRPEVLVAASALEPVTDSAPLIPSGKI
jgi:hypothetical protein